MAISIFLPTISLTLLSRCFLSSSSSLFACVAALTRKDYYLSCAVGASAGDGYHQRRASVAMGGRDRLAGNRQEGGRCHRQSRFAEYARALSSSVAEIPCSAGSPFFVMFLLNHSHLSIALSSSLSLSLSLSLSFHLSLSSFSPSISLFLSLLSLLSLSIALSLSLSRLVAPRSR